MKLVKVFVASPGDVKEERDIVNIVVNDLNSTLGDILDVHLTTIMWETHAWPDVGEDAQDVINKEIGEYDVFVGAMWKRFGTPTKRAESGTDEEFKRAYSFYKKFNRPKIMFYFKTKPFYSKNKDEINQFSKVLDFRKELEEFGVLFWEYTENIEFERDFRIHLSNQIKSIAKTYTTTTTTTTQNVIIPKIFISYKRKDLKRVEPLYDSLKASGFQPLMDVRDILPGGIWVDEIENMINESTIFLSIVSKNSVADEENETGFSVPQELNIALQNFEKDKPDLSSLDLPINSFIIPIRLDNVNPPAELAKYQWLDYFNEDGPEKLIHAIEQLLKRAKK